MEDMLPIDLVLVRHGQSEGNLANRRSEAGDNSAFTKEFTNRHSSSFRLTELGRTQAKLTGDWLKLQFGAGAYRSCFDRHITSEYTRAMETAALMDLPNARWYRDVYLTERNWGDLDICPENERIERFGDAMRRRIVQPFFWKPPNGESFLELCLRVDRVLNTLHRECSDQSVVVVCHGEVIRAIEVRIERITQGRFRELTFSRERWDRIYNGQVTHYTRRNPVNGALAKHANWVRRVRPNEFPDEGCDTGWKEIVRPTYTNLELLETVSLEPNMVL
jgi:NAD+ kinase